MVDQQDTKRKLGWIAKRGNCLAPAPHPVPTALALPASARAAGTLTDDAQRHFPDVSEDQPEQRWELVVQNQNAVTSVMMCRFQMH
jgi:hypothetical protein